MILPLSNQIQYPLKFMPNLRFTPNTITLGCSFSLPHQATLHLTLYYTAASPFFSILFSFLQCGSHTSQSIYLSYAPVNNPSCLILLLGKLGLQVKWLTWPLKWAKPTTISPSSLLRKEIVNLAL